MLCRQTIYSAIAILHQHPNSVSLASNMTEDKWLFEQSSGPSAPDYDAKAAACGPSSYHILGISRVRQPLLDYSVHIV